MKSYMRPRETDKEIESDWASGGPDIYGRKTRHLLQNGTVLEMSSSCWTGRLISLEATSAYLLCEACVPRFMAWDYIGLNQEDSIVCGSKGMLTSSIKAWLPVEWLVVHRAGRSLNLCWQWTQIPQRSRSFVLEKVVHHRKWCALGSGSPPHPSIPPLPKQHLDAVILLATVFQATRSWIALIGC